MVIWLDYPHSDLLNKINLYSVYCDQLFVIVFICVFYFHFNVLDN